MKTGSEENIINININRKVKMKIYSIVVEIVIENYYYNNM